MTSSEKTENAMKSHISFLVYTKIIIPPLPPHRRKYLCKKLRYKAL